MTTQIEAEIAQISLEIERQKDVLRKLESSKNVLQQQLNAIRDPIARLPLDISSDIFLQCLPPRSVYPREYPRPQAHDAPLLLLNSLIISFDHTDDLEDESYNLLGEMQPFMELPRLQVLEMFGVGVVECYWLSLHRLLRLAPNLTRLLMQNFSFLENLEDEEPEILILPYLCHLSHHRDFEGIKWISTPQLQTLRSSTEALSTEGFISFLRQASLPLRKLELIGDSNSVSRFKNSLAVIPTLTHLECLVPEPLTHTWLRTSKRCNYNEIIGATSYTDMLMALAGVLSVRRSRLKTVRFTIYRWEDPPSLTDDLTCFREFLEEGMHIHIALEDEPNMLSSS
ncbi:hypothetical protein FB45DRAFT_1075833 [Roridomyces roridus]|uniref:F-box domain-containing protein n=1 Tax=Roridomyces roridus TaxID=1738132 RepID=A0AAD7G0T2_9AGAR|nr:hypothetical protein FB45DRAFT_1075833 [Roridomyces roridus]